MQQGESGTYTVRDLAGTIARTVARAFPDEVWVRGEIRDLNRSRAGHVYFNLVDPSDDPSLPLVSIPVTLFSSDRDAVNRVLLKAGGAVRMSDGTEIRLRAAVAYYPPRGTVQLQMTWIDTDYTLGRLAAERDRLLRALAAEGLLEANRTRPVPLVPLRVGLVTGAGTAAYADFIHELEGSGFAFEVTVADAKVQGVEAPRSIVAALRALQGRDVDVIAVVRGGGARTDLAAFDNESVARAIASSGVPVFTGIGHEIDASIADDVAHTRFKTPTACAAGIVAVVAAYVHRLELLRSQLATATRHRLARTAGTLDDRTVRLGRATHAGMRVARATVDARAERMIRSVRRACSSASARVETMPRRAVSVASSRVQAMEDDLAHRGRALRAALTRRLRDASVYLDRLQAEVDASDPQRLQSMGWVMARTDAGAVIRRAASVQVGEILEIGFVDGVVRATAESVAIQAPDRVDGTDQGDDAT